MLVFVVKNVYTACQIKVTLFKTDRRIWMQTEHRDNARCSVCIQIRLSFFEKCYFDLHSKVSLAINVYKDVGRLWLAYIGTGLAGGTDDFLQHFPVGNGRISGLNRLILIE